MFIQVGKQAIPQSRYAVRSTLPSNREPNAVSPLLESPWPPHSQLFGGSSVRAPY